MSRDRSKTWPCSSCAYYQPYPSLDGVGTCDHTLSRFYSRMVMGGALPCEYYATGEGLVLESPGSEPGRGVPKGPRPGGTTCVYCHYWFPFELMPRMGQCYNLSSRYFGMAEFSDKPTEECFVERSLEGLDFMWCQSHRQTIYTTELPDHKECSVFVSSVGLPVEDQAELTLAGD